MTMTAALLEAMRAVHNTWDAVAVLFPYAPWVFALWGIGGIAMDHVMTNKGTHL